MKYWRPTAIDISIGEILTGYPLDTVTSRVYTMNTSRPSTEVRRSLDQVAAMGGTCLGGGQELATARCGLLLQISRFLPGGTLIHRPDRG